MSNCASRNIVPLQDIWEMLKIDGRMLLESYGQIVHLKQLTLFHNPQNRMAMSEGGANDVIKACQFLYKVCDGWGLEAAAGQINWLEKFLLERPKEPISQSGITTIAILINPPDVDGIRQTCDRFIVLVDSSIRDILLFSVTADDKRYWEKEGTIDGQAESLFLDAPIEISEASRCIALDRNTASVLHSMRALEPAIKYLCSKISLIPSNPNWHNVCQELESKITGWTRENRGEKWKQEQQYYSSAIAYLRACSKAWRNYAVHNHCSYSDSEAKDILTSVKSFLNALARQA